MHPAILRSLMRDGRPYGVPTGAHRSNVLWFNKALLERAGVSAPSSGYTLDAFLADLEKVKASGATALCLGGKDRFTTVELFENTLLSVIGDAAGKDMVDDDLDWRGDRAQTALERFGDDAALHRSAGERADVGRGHEEARGRAAARSSR